MEEKIHARIAELEAIEREIEPQLRVVRTLLSELRMLIAPDEPIVTGAPLGEVT